MCKYNFEKCETDMTFVKQPDVYIIVKHIHIQSNVFYACKLICIRVGKIGDRRERERERTGEARGGESLGAPIQNEARKRQWGRAREEGRWRREREGPWDRNIATPRPSSATPSLIGEAATRR